MRNASGLGTTTVLNTKIEAKNEIPGLTSIVKKKYHDAKSEIAGKYINSSDYYKFTSDILDAKIKQKEFVNKSDISNLVENADFSIELATSAKNQN